MDIEEFSEKFGDKMAEMKAYLEGGDVRELMGGLAIEHFRDSFHREGFVDKSVTPWQEVKRRQPDSPWYGHSGQTGRFSQARTTAPILSTPSKVTRFVLTLWYVSFCGIYTRQSTSVRTEAFAHPLGEKIRQRRSGSFL